MDSAEIAQKKLSAAAPNDLISITSAGAHHLKTGLN
jgi:hypothetical protein